MEWYEICKECSGPMLRGSGNSCDSANILSGETSRERKQYGFTATVRVKKPYALTPLFQTAKTTSS